MNQDTQTLWIALGELENHFSCLGGAARYRYMSESEIPLYIACVLAKRSDIHFKVEDYLNPKFAIAAAPVLEKTNNHVSAIRAAGYELFTLLEEFVAYADSKLSPEDRCTAWMLFVNQYRSRPQDPTDVIAANNAHLESRR